MRAHRENGRIRHPDIIAIGASAGGLAAISRLLAQLPADLPASVLVVLHRPPEQISSLREILTRKTCLHVVLARENEPLQHGTCYIGEPHRHLTLGPDSRLHLLADGFYRGHCIDALFCSLARHAGKRTIGVILSGALKDGSLGLKAIKEAGGSVMVRVRERPIFAESAREARRTYRHEWNACFADGGDRVCDPHRTRRSARGRSAGPWPCFGRAPLRSMSCCAKGTGAISQRECSFLPSHGVHSRDDSNRIVRGAQYVAPHHAQHHARTR